MASTVKDAGKMQKLNRMDVRLLWYVDFWDEPINGVCFCDGKKCWFERIADDEGSFPGTMRRRFLVVELSPEQLADEERWHELFRQKVGTHCDFEESLPEVRSTELHPEFYEAHKKRPKPDYSMNPVIGWFELK